MRSTAWPVPVLGGALAAIVVALRVGAWPGLPPIAGEPMMIASYVLLLTSLLMVAAAVAGPPSHVPGDRLVAPGAHPDRAHRGAGELLDPLHVGPGGGRQLVEGAQRRQVLEPAR
jgi:hypothetical protein